MYVMLNIVEVTDYNRRSETVHPPPSILES